MTVLPPLKAQAENAVLLQIVQQVSANLETDICFPSWESLILFFQHSGLFKLIKKPQSKQTNLYATTQLHVAVPWLCHRRYQFKLNWIFGDTLEKNLSLFRFH